MKRPFVSQAALVLAVLAVAGQCLAGERDAVVRIGGCTGFVVEGDLLVTAKHCRHPETVQVSVQGKTVTARRVYIYPGDDGPVVFHLEGGPYESLAVADRRPETGDPVYSLGYPGGNWARIEGVLKGGNGSDVNYSNHRIATGNSGGPLLNANGEVIGVALHVASDIAVHESGFAGWRVTIRAIREARARTGGGSDLGWRPIRKPVVVVFASEHCGPCQELKRDVRAGYFDDYRFVFVYWDAARRQWSEPELYREFQQSCNPSSGSLAFPTIWVKDTDQYRVGYAAERRGGLLGWLRNAVRHLLEGLIGRKDRHRFPDEPDFPEPESAPDQENVPAPQPSEPDSLVRKLLADIAALREEASKTKSELQEFKEAGVIGKIKALARLKSDKDEALERVEAVRADLRAIRDRFKAGPFQFLWGLFGLLSGLIHRRFAH